MDPSPADHAYAAAVGLGRLLTSSCSTIDAFYPRGRDPAKRLGARMPRFAANLGWMLQEVPMLERFQLARELGFEATECPLPYDTPARDLADACLAAGLEVLRLNAPPGDMQAGEYGRAGLAGRESEVRESIEQAMDYATILNSSFIHVLAGIVPPGESIERCRDV